MEWFFAMELREQIFVSLGIVVSVFYGLFAKQVWLWPLKEGPQSRSGFWGEEEAPPEDEQRGGKRRRWVEAEFRWTWRFHQLWINFAGCAAGWITLHYLIFKRGLPEAEAGYFDVFLVVVGVAGIMGFLPSIASKIQAKLGG